MSFIKKIFLRKLPKKQEIPFFDLEEIHSEFSDHMLENIRYTHSLALTSKEKVAFHASDADGIISALLLKIIDKNFSNAIFIPLSYYEIKHPKFGQFLKKIKWEAILDLPPFQESQIKLYVDHHASNKGLSKLADLILFDEFAPSAAFLLAKYFEDKLTEDLLLLAKLTTITDTADYTLNPPIDYPSGFPSSIQEQAWMLDDLCRTPESSLDVLSLLKDIETKRLAVFDETVYKHRIMKLRTNRKKTIELGENFEIADVLIIIQGKKKIMTSSLVHSLFTKGVKITCIIFPGKQFVGLSFRVTNQIPDSELEYFRVDQIATKLLGGGHPRAAGGRSTNLKAALIEVMDWVEEKGMKYRTYDLRKKNDFNL